MEEHISQTHTHKQQAHNNAYTPKSSSQPVENCCYTLCLLTDNYW